MWIYQTTSPMKIGQKIKRNNRGFTLVEIVLVLGIGALLAVLSLTGLNYLNYGNTKKCAQRLLDRLDVVQAANMTQEGATYLGIFREGDALYVQNLEISRNASSVLSRSDVSKASAEKIAEEPIELKWSDSGEIRVLDENTLLLVGFSRTSGAYLTKQPGSGGIVYAGDFWISGNGIYHIIQVAETGKHYIEE